MLKLIFCIHWLELTRLKQRIWLLATVLLIFPLIATSCDMKLDTSSDPAAQQLMQIKLFTMMPQLAWLILSLFVGLVVVAALPLRGREEWESGQFQLMVMGQFHQLRVQLARFAVYFNLSLLYFLGICGMIGYVLWKTDALSGPLPLVLAKILGFWFITIVPLLVSFGILMAGVNIAYYRDGQQKILTPIRYLGGLAVLSVLGKFVGMIQQSPPFFTPEKLDINMVGQVFEFYLHGELPLFSFLVALIFLAWSGQILEEVET